MVQKSVWSIEGSCLNRYHKQELRKLLPWFEPAIVLYNEFEFGFYYLYLVYTCKLEINQDGYRYFIIYSNTSAKKETAFFSLPYPKHRWSAKTCLLSEVCFFRFALELQV